MGEARRSRAGMARWAKSRRVEVEVEVECPGLVSHARREEGAKCEVRGAMCACAVRRVDVESQVLLAYHRAVNKAQGTRRWLAATPKLLDSRPQATSTGAALNKWDAARRWWTRAGGVVGGTLGCTWLQLAAALLPLHAFGGPDAGQSRPIKQTQRRAR